MNTILLISVFCMMSITLFSTILTVDNNVPSVGQYSSLQLAHNAAADNDTIFVFPSNLNYNGIQVTKRLMIIGSGFCPENRDGIIIKGTKLSGEMQFQSGSAYSKLEGFGGFFNTLINCNNITLAKNQINCLSSSGPCALIIQNHFLVSGENVYYTPTGYSYFIAGYSNGCHLYNNLFEWTQSTTGSLYFAPRFDGNPVFVNNIFINQYQVWNVVWPGGGSTSNNYAFFSSNIFIRLGYANISRYEFYHNVSDNYSIPAGNGNIPNVDTASLFTNGYHLQQNCVAIDAGDPDLSRYDLDNTLNDCGVYGGPTPFVDGGIPGYPAIYEINGPGVATPNETIPIQIRAKTNRD